MSSHELPELTFTHPLPGFPGLRRFVLVRLDDTGSRDAVDTQGHEPGSVLFELRSLERPDVRFLTAVPSAFFPDYQVELDAKSCDELGLTDPDDALVLVILTMGSDAGATTANLLAPVVINARTRTGAQMILSGSDWPVRAALH